MKKIVIPELSPEALAQVVTETPVIEPVVKEIVIEPAAVVVDPTIQLSEEITQLKGQIEGHAEVLAAKDAEYAALKASAEGVKGIVVSQISRMRTAMSLAQVDMSALDLDAVLVEYSAVVTNFNKFPVGGVVTKTEEKQAEKIIATSLDASAYKSVGF